VVSLAPHLVPVYDSHGTEIIGHVERAAPVCGEDFCDECGDCLYCYGDDECPSASGVHNWIYYENKLPDGAVLIRKEKS